MEHLNAIELEILLHFIFQITHCFGNRALMTAYRSFLQVLEDCEWELVNGNSQSADAERPIINLGGADTPQIFTNGAVAMNTTPF